MVLAIGQHHHKLRCRPGEVRRTAARQKLLALLERAANRRALHRHLLGVEPVEIEPDGTIVARQRRLHEAHAGEDDQADTVAVQLAEQGVDLALCSPEPRRRDVVGKHAARHVDGDDQVDAFALDLARPFAPLRSRQREPCEQQRKRKEDGPCSPSRQRDLRRHLLYRDRCAEAFHHRRTPPPPEQICAHIEQRREAKHQHLRLGQRHKLPDRCNRKRAHQRSQSEEREGSLKAHGNLRMSVPPSSASAIRSASAAARNQW